MDAHHGLVSSVEQPQSSLQLAPDTTTESPKPQPNDLPRQVGPTPTQAFDVNSVLGPEPPSRAVQRSIVESLIEEGMVRFRWEQAYFVNDGIASGTDLLEACRSLFALGNELDSFICPVPDDRADLGFYRFAVNNLSGGLRTYSEGVHQGLPLSGIWNHRAADNPHWFRLVQEQRTFDRFVGTYTAVIAAITAALTATV